MKFTKQIKVINWRDTMYKDYGLDIPLVQEQMDELNKIMQAKMLERGFIFNRTMRRAYDKQPSTFHCLEWCVRTSFYDIMREIYDKCQMIKKIGVSLVSSPELIFTVSYDNEGDFNNIVDMVISGNGRTKERFNVEKTTLVTYARKKLEAESSSLFNEPQA